MSRRRAGPSSEGLVRPSASSESRRARARPGRGVEPRLDYHASLRTMRIVHLEQRTPLPETPGGGKSDQETVAGPEGGFKRGKIAGGGRTGQAGPWRGGGWGFRAGRGCGTTDRMGLTFANPATRRSVSWRADEITQWVWGMEYIDELLMHLCDTKVRRGRDTLRRVIRRGRRQDLLRVAHLHVERDCDLKQNSGAGAGEMAQIRMTSDFLRNLSPRCE